MRLRERQTQSSTAKTLWTTNTSTAKNNTFNGESNSRSKNRNRSIIQRWIPFLAGFVVLILLGRWRIQSIPRVLVLDTTSNVTDTFNWCDRVTNARADLNPDLAIRYPCETMNSPSAAAVVSVVVCMLTGSVDPNRANKILFTAREYISGAMALGFTVRQNIDPSRTHMLLLLKEGFELAPDDILRLRAVGWTIGTAPDFQLLKKYVPIYERYTTTYTKITAIGLSEYKCALLMDADTLVVGDIKSLMTCNKFTHPEHRVAGTLDLDRGRWNGINTGSILWRTSSSEMNRVFQLSRNDTFMKRFSSDQEFLNNVYPERFNRTLNELIMKGNFPPEHNHGAVVDLTWDYNAQTHLEGEKVEWWGSQRSNVKILHFTRRKGWQCEERYDDPPSLAEMPKTCHRDKGGLRSKDEAPICYCREAHRYYNALKHAKELGDQAILEH
mmetsp:Transcript_44306/g.86962  ORF Transcript_44306/g.86962 Transcript_44306/m.86962 type:complete len:441 (+) Transcript_44306:140-1462(+)